MAENELKNSGNGDNDKKQELLQWATDNSISIQWVEKFESFPIMAESYEDNEKGKERFRSHFNIIDNAQNANDVSKLFIKLREYRQEEQRVIFVARRQSPVLSNPYLVHASHGRVDNKLLKQAIKEYYGTLDCFLFGKKKPPRPWWYRGEMVVKSSHIFPLGNDDMRSHLDSIESRHGFKKIDMNECKNNEKEEKNLEFGRLTSLNDVRNLLRLYGPLEEAFDGCYVSFIYRPFESGFACYVWDTSDKWLMQYCHGKLLAYPRKDKLPSLRLLAIQLEFAMQQWSDGLDENTKELVKSSVQLSLDFSCTISNPPPSSFCHSCLEKVESIDVSSHGDSAQHLQKIGSFIGNKSENQAIPTNFGFARIVSKNCENDNSNNDNNNNINGTPITVEFENEKEAKRIDLVPNQIGFVDTRGPSEVSKKFSSGADSFAFSNQGWNFEALKARSAGQQEYLADKWMLTHSHDNVEREESIVSFAHIDADEEWKNGVINKYIDNYKNSN